MAKLILDASALHLESITLPPNLEGILEKYREIRERDKVSFVELHRRMVELNKRGYGDRVPTLNTLRDILNGKRNNPSVANVIAVPHALGYEFAVIRLNIEADALPIIR